LVQIRLVTQVNILKSLHPMGSDAVDCRTNTPEVGVANFGASRPQKARNPGVTPPP
jgi:hypothetical protein